MREGWNDKRFVLNTMTVNRKYLPLKKMKTENSSLFNNLFKVYIGFYKDCMVLVLVIV